MEEQDLRNLKLGYRAKYVHQVAKVFEQDPKYLSRVIQSDYEDAKSSLVKLPGVGPKIAILGPTPGSLTNDDFASS